MATTKVWLVRYDDTTSLMFRNPRKVHDLRTVEQIVLSKKTLKSLFGIARVRKGHARQVNLELEEIWAPSG